MARGLQLERKITDQLPLGVDLFRQTPGKIGGLPLTGFNAGGIYDFCRSLSFPFLGWKMFPARQGDERILLVYRGLEVTGGEQPPKAQEAAPWFKHLKRFVIQADHWHGLMVRTYPHD